MTKTLIYIIGENNEECLFSSEYENPENIIFLYEKSLRSKFENLIIYFQKRSLVKHISSEEICTNNIFDIFDKYINKDVIIDISSADKKISLETLFYGIKNCVPILYIDINNCEVVKYIRNDIVKEKAEFSDLNVKQIMDSSGAKIVLESTNIENEKIIYELTMLIANNMSEWNSIKEYIMTNNLIENKDDCTNGIYFHIEKIDKKHINQIRKLMEILKRYNQIDCKSENGTIEILFRNNYIKGFLFKVGSWFEIFTKIIVEDIEFIDDVKSGVLFQWNKGENHIKNEIDVVAVKDGILICISCKDSSRYDEAALNELNVYAQKIGGDNAIKILVATKSPTKTTVIKRAVEMGIGIIIYDGDQDKFKKDLRQFIKSNIDSKNK